MGYVPTPAAVLVEAGTSTERETFIAKTVPVKIRKKEVKLAIVTRSTFLRLEHGRENFFT
jgi:hypothetical protein